MCRLFAQLSVHPSTITRDVLDSDYSILKEVIKEGHTDGWGALFYERNEIRLHIRSTNPLTAEADLARAILNSKPSTASGFFVRKASNPLKLRFEEIHTAEATQPFVHTNLAFMHNGSVERPDLIMPSINDPEVVPQSKNDSEVYFAVFLSSLRKTGSVPEAFKEAERLIRNAGGNDPYSSLNSIVIYNGRLYAFNMYRKDYKGTVRDPERDYFKMSFWADDEMIIVSSEPTNEDQGWKDLGNGKIMEAWNDHGVIRYRVIE